jgi:hypothetical protein
VEVDLGHLRQHEVQELRPVEPPDLGVEVELLDHVPRFGVEGGDPGAEVAGHLGRIGEDLLEGQRAGVVDIRQARDRLEDRADVLDLAGERYQAGEDLRLRGLEDAVEPAQHDEREDDPPVLGLLVVTPQQVGDRPDEAGVVVDPVGRRGCLIHLPTLMARAASLDALPSGECSKGKHSEPQSHGPSLDVRAVGRNWS